jgi:uncharacterized DUF497 family protein
VLDYTWDPAKEVANVRKHGIMFDEARTVLDHEATRTALDERHSDVEARFWTVGWSNRGRLLVVVTSECGPRPRIISARRATKRERHDCARRGR